VARVTVAIALGSSLGERAAHLAFARDQLSRLLTDCRHSSVFETAPVDVIGEQTPFFNAACVGGADLSAPDLLSALHAIERARGRERPHRNAPRTLDLDLILYGAAVIDEPGLTIPHPRFRGRRFVLDPLAEVAPDLIDPLTGKTVAMLRARLRQAEREPDA